jgi:hypothetical protein
LQHNHLLNEFFRGLFIEISEQAQVSAFPDIPYSVRCQRI